MKLPDWRVWPSPARLNHIIQLASLASLLLFALIQILDRPLQPFTIVSLELAFRPDQAAPVLAAWGPRGIAIARQSLYIDFALMPAYAFAFAGLVLTAARAVIGGRQKLGFRLLAAPFAAWAYDFTENLVLLLVLSDPAAVSTAGAPLALAGIAATLKFALLIACLIYGLAVLAWRREAVPNKPSAP